MKRWLARGGWLNAALALLLGLPILALGAGRALGFGQRTATRPLAAPEPRVALVHWPAAPSDDEGATMVNQALELARGEQGMAALVSPGDTVLLKVNLGLGVEAHEITSWQVARAVAIAAQAAGAGRVVIGESPQLGLAHYDQAGYTEHIQGVEYVDFSAASAPLTSVAAPDGFWPQGEALILPQVYLDADVVISIPKMKTHSTAGVTCALKNAVGVPPLGSYSSSAEMGYRDLFHNQYGIHKTIAQINLIRPPDLTVVDAILCGEGAGPWGATPVQTNLILASRDPVAADAVAASAMGFTPWKVRHIVYAASAGLGEADLGRIEMVGASLDDVRRAFDPPVTRTATLFRGAAILPASPGGLTLDGDLAEWQGRDPWAVAGSAQVQAGAAQWQGAADASLSAWAAYDEDALYLAWRVWDDALAPNARGAGALWDGDAVEVYFSGASQDQPGRGAAYAADDFRLGVGYGQEAVADIGRGAWLVGATVARQALADGYALEARLPWSARHGFVPARNREVGLDFALDDADGVANRQTQLIWSGTAALASDVREMGVALLRDIAAEPIATPTPTATVTATETPSPTIPATPTMTATPEPTSPPPTAEAKRVYLPLALR